MPGISEAVRKLERADLDDIFEGLAIGINSGAIRVDKGEILTIWPFSIIL